MHPAFHLADVADAMMPAFRRFFATMLHQHRNKELTSAIVESALDPMLGTHGLYVLLSDMQTLAIPARLATSMQICLLSALSSLITICALWLCCIFGSRYARQIARPGFVREVIA